MDNLLIPNSEQIRHKVAIAGCVIDAVTKQAIQGAAVEIKGKNLLTLTREDGSFYFQDLPNGSYNLDIWAANLGSRYGVASVTDVSVPNLEVKVQLQPTRLVGQIQRQDNNLPIAKAIVKVRGSELQTFTDKDGRYILSCEMQKGSPTIEIYAKGFSTEIQKVTLTAGEETILNIQLTSKS
ncbi:MAG: carboxypeptidase regulatory-like domain-containing protein [Nostocaceae cyanobacterium]|nr:carboxypeptidase regulatory-like domain-containing protein [Nostocaceae cyanobacterium]